MLGHVPLGISIDIGSFPLPGNNFDNLNPDMKLKGTWPLGKKAFRELTCAGQG